MVVENTSVETPTARDKKWYHEQYYFGKRDKDNRKQGYGENHWTGAESLENYTGRFVQNAMHGNGEYRWRFLGPNGDDATYEGYFFCNRLHGYGMLSSGDGQVFRGLYLNDMRWGPGIETFPSRRANVGVWRGRQLIRLAWRPPVTSIIPNLCQDVFGAEYVKQFRTKMTTNILKPWEVNHAIDLLRQWGADPVLADKKWKYLYSRNCTDLQSLMCHKESFLQSYYDGQIDTLNEIDVESVEVASTATTTNEETQAEEKKQYLAWNNSDFMKTVMKHAFTHDYQRTQISDLDLLTILSGPRRTYRPGGRHENDCRTLLMASYLGKTAKVLRMINEFKVNPNVSDALGNTPIMYATCSDDNEIIQVLLDAGANVDMMNDSCCSALSIALMRYACVQAEVPVTAIADNVIPKVILGSTQDKPDKQGEDWNIDRIVQIEPLPTQPRKSFLHARLSRTKTGSSRMLKSMSSFRNVARKGHNAEQESKKEDNISDFSDSISENTDIYLMITSEFCNRMMNIVSNSVIPSNVNLSYLFHIVDLATSVLEQETDTKKGGGEPDKSAKITKTEQKVHIMSKLSIQAMDFIDSTTSINKLKNETLEQIQCTILQLLEAGADPKLVRCPQAALVMAIVGKSPEIIRHLVARGADPNEVYPLMNNYTPLAVVLARELSPETPLLVRALLELGADPNVTIAFEDPTGIFESGARIPLLFSALYKTHETPVEDEVFKDVMSLLIEFGCDAYASFNGHTVLDAAMNSNTEVLNHIIKCPNLNLNKEINGKHQNILVKFFSPSYFHCQNPIDRLNMLSNFLLYGADPMLSCRDGDQEFPNLFAYTKFISETFFKPKDANVSVSSMTRRNRRSSFLSTGPAKGQGSEDERNQYFEAIALMVECARMLHIRWLQAKLLKDLIDIVAKYKHRNWPSIMREHKNKKQCRVWLTPQKCLETWHVLKTQKKKIYNDNTILRMTLCIIHFYNNERNTNRKLRYKEFCEIEDDINRLLKEHVDQSKNEDQNVVLNAHVKPELVSKNAKKFSICFVCCQPLDKEFQLQCRLCKLIYFCSDKCMNTPQTSHPCYDEASSNLSKEVLTKKSTTIGTLSDAPTYKYDY